MSQNKHEERNLAIRLQQINKEKRTAVTSIKREIKIMKHAFETNKDRIELLRKQKQILHDENLRRLIELNRSKMDMAIMNVYNTSKNLSAFYNLSALKHSVQPQQQQSQQSLQHNSLIKRSPSRLSARNKYLISLKARICHSSYAPSNVSSKMEQQSTAKSKLYIVDDLNSNVDGGLIGDDDNMSLFSVSKGLSLRKSSVNIRQSASAPVNHKRSFKLDFGDF